MTAPVVYLVPHGEEGHFESRACGECRAFLDELARVIDSLQQATTTDADDQDDVDGDEEEDTTAPRTGRAAALSAYMQAVRAQARAAASKRPVTKASRNGKIIEWLGDRRLNEGDRAEVGASLLVQTNARRFVSPAPGVVRPSATSETMARASVPVQYFPIQVSLLRNSPGASCCAAAFALRE